MEIGAMLDELREKALKDRNIWQELMDTRKAEQPLAAICLNMLLKACEEKFIEIVFPCKLRRVFTSTVGTSSHGSIKFFSGCDQIHLINLISQFPTLRAESGKWLFCLSGVHQFL